MAKKKKKKATGKTKKTAKKSKPSIKKTISKIFKKKSVKSTKKTAKKTPAKKPAKTPTKKTTKTAKPKPAKAKAEVKKPRPVPAAAPPPLKVEPKVIETTQQEYKPVEHAAELFTEAEIKSFRTLLEEERDKILTKARLAVEQGNIQFDKNEMYDEVDQASAMVEQNLNLRLLDRDRKLLGEINHALDKIDTGEFGYCEGTGEPIPKRRLELRPWCRHSVKYKERLERMKKSGRGVGDEDEL